MVQRITIAPQGPEFSRFVMGYWRLMDWNMSARQLVSFIEEHLDLGVTTVDHADIYGGYQCEAAFGEALKLAPHLRERMEIVSKCGIATTAREENVIGHYITDRDHIIKSAEQSLINLATDHLDLLLIHRPDPLMDADEVQMRLNICIRAEKYAILASPTSRLRNLRCCNRACRLPLPLIRWKYPRCISRYCWMARSTNCNNCVFARWPGLVLAVVVCLMMIISGRYVMNLLWWRKN